VALEVLLRPLMLQMESLEEMEGQHHLAHLLQQVEWAAVEDLLHQD